MEELVQAQADAANAAAAAVVAAETAAARAQRVAELKELARASWKPLLIGVAVGVAAVFGVQGLMPSTPWYRKLF